MKVLFQILARTFTFVTAPIFHKGHSNQMQREVPLEQLWKGKNGMRQGKRISGELFKGRLV